MHTVEYTDYLKSARWERRKVAYYAKHPKVCRACGDTQDIHLHHHTYKRLGHEHDTDLVPLCKSHHESVHRLHRADRTLSLTEATRLVVGKSLHPPRSRKKPRRKREQPKGQRLTRRMVTLDVLSERMCVTKTALRQQGYHRGVPVETVKGWIKRAPYWTAPEVCAQLADLV